MDSFLPHAFPSPSLPLEFNMYVRPCQHHGRKSSYAFMSTGRSVRAHVTVSYIGHVDVCEPDATDEADEQLPALACSFFSFSVSFSVFLFPFIFFASRRGNGKAWNNFVWLRSANAFAFHRHFIPETVTAQSVGLNCPIAPKGFGPCNDPRSNPTSSMRMPFPGAHRKVTKSSSSSS